MKQIREYLTTKIVKKTRIVATDETIHQIVKDQFDSNGHDCDMNHIDVSKVTDMHNLFCVGPLMTKLNSESYLDINPDVSEWDVSNVKTMNSMFRYCEKFNCDLSKWDVSNVASMYCMFNGCETFNQNLSKWDVSSVEAMSHMFINCKKFNCNIGSWDVRKVRSILGMFHNCESFDQDLSRWQLDEIVIGNFTYEEYLSSVFANCPIKDEHKPKF